MKKREEIWHWKEQSEYRQVYVRILLNAYIAYTQRGNRLQPPLQVVEASSFQIGNVVSKADFFEQLMHYFVFDGREDSITTAEELRVVADSLEITPVALGMKIASVVTKLRIPERTIFPFVKKVKGKCFKYWKGMRTRTQVNYAPSFVPHGSQEVEYLTDFEQWRSLMETHAGVIPTDIMKNLVQAGQLASFTRALTTEEKEFVLEWGTKENRETCSRKRTLESIDA
jgi:hypothetical protein